MFGAMLKVMKDVDQYKELLYAFNGSLDPRRIVQAVSLLLLRDVSEAKLVAGLDYGHEAARATASETATTVHHGYPYCYSDASDAARRLPQLLKNGIFG